MSKKYCPACGTELAVTDAKFCEICGFAITSPTQSQTNFQSHSATEQNTYGKNPIQPNQNLQSGISQPTIRVSQPQYSPTSNISGIKYVDFGDRLIAFIIDMIIVNAVISSIFFWTEEGLSVLLTFFNFLYFWLAEMINDGNGQTLGKKIMKIRTVDEFTLGKITPQQALVHALGKGFFVVLDVIIGAIMRDQDEKQRKQQGLGDNYQIRATQRLAHTVVISLK